MEENETINQEVHNEECTGHNEERTGLSEECTGHNEEGATSAEPVASQGPRPEVTRVDLEEVLAAAERRGYLKGRNERIEELMSRPRELEAPTQSAKALILNHIRRSIWD